MPEGGESPPPERQSGKQIHEPPASGQGVQNVDSKAKKGEMEDQLKGLSSNPKPIMEDTVKKKFSKEPGN